MTLFHLYTEGSRALAHAGDRDAQVDARELLLAAFHIDLAHYLLNRMRTLPEDDFSQEAAKWYRSMVGKRCRHVPLQQILGSTEFMGLTFKVNEHVLIPRQDTETLVELVLGYCKRQDGTCQSAPVPTRERKLLDMCTGSGCIAVSLAVKGKFARVDAVDISEKALEVARRNAAAWSPGIHFYLGDLFDALPHDGEKYDIIVSNPPYIPTGVIAALEPEVKDYEPILALDGSQDGLLYYRRIAADAGKFLKPGGGLFLEIGDRQAKPVSLLMHGAGYGQVQVFQDLTGHDRVVYARQER